MFYACWFHSYNYSLGKLPTKTTMTAQYAAVAEKISQLRDDVNQQSAEEKTPVKAAMTQSRVGTALTVYSMPMGTTRVATAKIVVSARETATTLDCLMNWI